MKKIFFCLYCICLLFLGASLIGFTCSADESLAARYAPVLYFEKNEKCYPVDVSYMLENSYLYAIGTPAPLATSLTATMLANYTSDNYYLDNQRGTVVEGDDGIENDYQSRMDLIGYTVYARVDTANNVIQYWFFYAFNAGDLNRHEGDWEMVQVALSGGQPTHVMFSQHYAGQSATWDQVDKEGDHVKVYVARGSHANYIKSYSGKIGLSRDTVGDNGKILRPQTDYEIQLLDESLHPWLDFPGRWGWNGETESKAAESSVLGKVGPHGPKFREAGIMWQQPRVWASGLHPVNDQLFIMEWILYNFVILFLLLTILSLLLVIVFAYRRHKKYGLGPRTLSLFYIDGMNAKSIGNILCIIALIIAILGLMYPWYTVTADVSALSYQGRGSFDAISIDGLNGIQISLPDKSGPIPLGAFDIPFYVIIGVGLLFLVLTTVGVSQSQKLGKKYIHRGIRLIIPFTLLVIFVMSIGMILPSVAPGIIKDNTDVFNAANAISSSPFSGQYSLEISEISGGYVNLNWGFGIGMYLLVFAAIILIIAGLMQLSAHTTFFTEKGAELPKKEKNKELQDANDKV